MIHHNLMPLRNVRSTTGAGCDIKEIRSECQALPRKNRHGYVTKASRIGSRTGRNYFFLNLPNGFPFQAIHDHFQDGKNIFTDIARHGNQHDVFSHPPPSGKDHGFDGGDTGSGAHFPQDGIPHLLIRENFQRSDGLAVTGRASHDSVVAEDHAHFRRVGFPFDFFHKIAQRRQNRLLIRVFERCRKLVPFITIFPRIRPNLTNFPRSCKWCCFLPALLI